MCAREGHGGVTDGQDSTPAAAPPARAMAESTKLRILALNMCLLPAGMNFSGSFLVDGNDRKRERLAMLLQLIEDYDIVLLNEMWGCKWSSAYYGAFITSAQEEGFHVVSDPIGPISNTGNMILSRTPLHCATSMVYKSTAGWQSIVSNGVLHAATTLPDGQLLHLFTTHLQCTTAPESAGATESPQKKEFSGGVATRIQERRHSAEDLNAGTAHVLNLVEAGTETVRQRQLLELKSFMNRHVCLEEDMWLLAGDLNIEGGSAEYYRMVDLFGREALGAPDFESTYNTESFLTPPGWRGVEYSVSLDHVLTNLNNVADYSVLSDNISDHRPLSVTLNSPAPQRRGTGKGARDRGELSQGSVLMPATRGAMLPSMVTWAPGTLCLGPGPGLTAKSNAGSDSATTASGSSTVGGNKARRRRRGSDVKSPVPSCSADGDRVSSPVPGSASASASPSADDRPAPRHEIATVEAVPGAKRDFLLKAAWTPGQLAARLLMPGACEFMGAVAQTNAYSSLKNRLSASPNAAATMSAEQRLQRLGAASSPIPVSQL